jgi:hypothetical protein
MRTKSGFGIAFKIGSAPHPPAVEEEQDLDEAEYDDAEELQELVEERERWLADGSFVWWWAKDYYMSREGKVDST